MDRELIFELIDRLERSSLTSLELTLGESRIRLERGVSGSLPAASKEAAVSPLPPVLPEETPKAPAASGKVVTSPIVGTFYRSPAPGEAPFVSVGSAVKPGDTLCIVEAMKLLNEIECESAGTVSEILAEDGALIEFGQPLFVIS